MKMELDLDEFQVVTILAALDHHRRELVIYYDDMEPDSAPARRMYRDLIAVEQLQEQILNKYGQDDRQNPNTQT